MREPGLVDRREQPVVEMTEVDPLDARAERRAARMDGKAGRWHLRARQRRLRASRSASASDPSDVEGVASCLAA